MTDTSFTFINKQGGIYDAFTNGPEQLNGVLQVSLRERKQSLHDPAKGWADQFVFNLNGNEGDIRNSATLNFEGSFLFFPDWLSCPA